tara:strand:+ start:128 stop:1762 length:1635 start_codon:yes stop_codon:yes gene_type:complete
MVILLTLKENRPVIIDGANVSRTHTDDRRGSALGLVSAYSFCKTLGYDDVKIYIKRYRVKGFPEQCLLDIEAISEIPDSDIILIPDDLDDDAFFMRDSIEKDTILITNDRLREYREYLRGKERKVFDAWFTESRCGFTFIRGEFSPDPDFSELNPISFDPAKDGKSKKFSPSAAMRMNRTKAKEEADNLNSRIYEETKGTTIDKIEERLQSEKEHVLQLRNERDNSNLRAKEKVLERNEINEQVRHLITEVRVLKELRNRVNKKVKELRKKRGDLDKQLKEIRKSPEPDKSRESRLAEQQQEAHEEVEKSVGVSNVAHESMVETSERADSLRAQANEAHKEWQDSLKPLSDNAHRNFIGQIGIIEALEHTIALRKEEEEYAQLRPEIEKVLQKINALSPRDFREIVTDSVISAISESQDLYEDQIEEINTSLVNVREVRRFASVQILCKFEVLPVIIGEGGKNIRAARSLICSRVGVPEDHVRFVVNRPTSNPDNQQEQTQEFLLEKYDHDELKKLSSQMGLKTDKRLGKERLAEQVSSEFFRH